MNYYLLGYPVGHSVSPAMHNAAFKELDLPHRYNLLETRPENLGETVQGLRENIMGGANVTIPHKIEIIKHMDTLAASAKQIGAVNTIENRGGQLIGHNTDASGGIKALTEKYGELNENRVVLLGAGGAARALAQELAPKVSELVILNRSPEKAEKLAHTLPGNTVGAGLCEQRVINTADIVINATSVGMAPNTSESPIEAQYLRKGQLVYDIVYNPIKTRLMRDAEKAGAETLGGLWMLVYQGVEAFKIWTDLEPNPETMYRAALRVLEAGH
ncbi:MAG: shikimate dehydrogenase [Candidatus Bathyarchaeota archaeon]|nr:shikimate dehydrogenase [Candidatus Bathyarchaeota archaeon]